MIWRVGKQYFIYFLGTTDWTLYGAVHNVVGEVFTTTSTNTSGTIPPGFVGEYVGYHKRILPLMNTNANHTLSSTAFPQYKTNQNSVEPDQDYSKLAKDIIPPFADYFDDTTGTTNRFDIWEKPILLGSTTDVNTVVNLTPSAVTESYSADGPVTFTLSQDIVRGTEVSFSGFIGALSDLNGTTKYARPVGNGAHWFYSNYDSNTDTFTNPYVKRDNITTSVGANGAEIELRTA